MAYNCSFWSINDYLWRCFIYAWLYWRFIFIKIWFLYDYLYDDRVVKRYYSWRYLWRTTYLYCSKRSSYGYVVIHCFRSYVLFAFFWAFFHSSFNPQLVLGNVWPPLFLTILDTWAVPFLNTVILLTSGATITVAHHAIVWGSKSYAIIGLICTIALAIVFTGLQAFEYVTAPFNISDSVYGACFYMTTGFHGFHVFIGTCFLTVCLVRLYFNHFTREHHFGFEAAAWYWHFVDVVWLFLFVTIYWWGS